MSSARPPSSSTHSNLLVAQKSPPPIEQVECLPPFTKVPDETKHFNYINAVRGIAFLAVIACHAALCVAEFPGSLLIKAGGWGVQLFFLASAITLCYSLDERSKTDSYPVLFFYIRRLFRIAPLFWIAIIFYWTFTAIMPQFWLGQWAPYGIKKSYFILTALFLHGWHPYTFNSIVPGGWSIAVEMNFYIVFPLLFLKLNTFKKSAIAVLIGIFVLPKLEQPFREYLNIHFYHGMEGGVFPFFSAQWFPAQIGVFLIGMFTYYCLQCPEIKRLTSKRFLSSAGLLILILMCLRLLQHGENGPMKCAITTIAMGIFIVSMSHSLIPLVVNSVICYIGTISYSCYIVHFAALGITLNILGVTLTNEQHHYNAGGAMSNFLLFSEIFFIALLLTIGLSTLTLHLVEKPGIAIGRKIIKYITAQSLKGCSRAQVNP